MTSRPVRPQISFAQFLSLAPLGFFAAAAHAGAVFAMSAGAVSFGQIVKAAECAAAIPAAHILRMTSSRAAHRPIAALSVER